MNGRRAVVGLTLLCALLFSAFAAGSASATPGTTVAICSAAAGIKDFSDAHCDSGTEEGTYGHTEIGEGLETEVEITNAKTKSETKESTPAILKGTVFGVAGEVTCTTASGTGKSTNVENSEVMQNEGTNIAIKYTGCTVNKPTNCKIKEPFEVTGSSITVENLGGGKNEMGLEFKPKGETLAELTFEGEKCAIKGQTFKVQGTMVATGSRGDTEETTSSGGTLIFTNSMTKETLKLGGSAAEFSSTFTVNTTEEKKQALTLMTPRTEEAGECPVEPEWEEEDCELVEGKGPAEAALELAFKQEEECPAKKAGETSTRDPIVFVHGWNGGLGTFKTMRKRFSEAGWPEAWLCNFNYRWWKANSTSAERVQERVEKVLKETGAKKADIISHSMGALSSRFYIKEKKGFEKINQWVSLGSPNQGTLTAATCFTIFTACKDMVPGSSFLKKLNEKPPPAGPEYATWRAGYEHFFFKKVTVGCDIVIMFPSWAELPGANKNEITECMSHSALHENKGVFEKVEKFVK